MPDGLVEEVGLYRSEDSAEHGALGPFGAWCLVGPPVNDLPLHLGGGERGGPPRRGVEGEAAASGLSPGDAPGNGVSELPQLGVALPPLRPRGFGPVGRDGFAENRGQHPLETPHAQSEGHGVVHLLADLPPEGRTRFVGQEPSPGGLVEASGQVLCELHVPGEGVGDVAVAAREVSGDELPGRRSRQGSSHIASDGGQQQAGAPLRGLLVGVLADGHRPLVPRKEVRVEPPSSLLLPQRVEGEGAGALAGAP